MLTDKRRNFAVTYLRGGIGERTAAKKLGITREKFIRIVIAYAKELM